MSGIKEIVGKHNYANMTREAAIERVEASCPEGWKCRIGNPPEDKSNAGFLVPPNAIQVGSLKPLRHRPELQAIYVFPED